MSSATPTDDASNNAASVSVVLPIGEDDNGLGEVLQAYLHELEKLVAPWEMLLVPESAHPPRGHYEQLEAVGVRVCPPAAGWGAAVSAGLRASSGEILCYTNWRRTSGAALIEMLLLAGRNPALVVRANRRTRDTRVRRLGSLLFNLECRLVLQIPAWDVNGTPKAFPRTFTKLLGLSEQGDLLDAEFALVCERESYPVVELPIDATLLSGCSERLDFGAAMRMYYGVVRLRTMRRRWSV